MKLLLLWACTATKESLPEESEAPLLTLAQDVQPIFNAHCIVCHGALPAPEGLSLAEGSAWVDHRSSQVPTMVLLEPASPDSSYLWLKLLGEHVSMGGYGTKMPPDETLGSAELGIIESWITAGALP